VKKIVVGLIAVLFMVLIVSTVKADPVNVAWYVTDSFGNPVDGAKLTIYWATSSSGPFTIMPANDGAGTYVFDEIAKVRQNPIYTGRWNPDHPHGMAVCDIHPKGGLDGLYFYVKIEYGSTVKYWPTALSYKPGEPSWAPVAATGSPSGYAAAGPGLGNGVTTAYPTYVCPPQLAIPEVPLGTIVAMVSLVSAFGAYFGLRKRKPVML
jgi:hypothetical protein